ncbi:hypothetical protein [Xanthomonas sp. 4461]|uniref:hypothetical protein n=1 Tax=Xanthomonas sp. 4461 TaxID=3035313 RepID=UPI00216A217C|nr:hypothetical protein [Xanthomonas sp. 4461]MCS3810874.1 hypothetical protein [Xanthomonas sp. 4461]
MSYSVQTVAVRSKIVYDFHDVIATTLDPLLHANLEAIGIGPLHALGIQVHRLSRFNHSSGDDKISMVNRFFLGEFIERAFSNGLASKGTEWK